MSRKVRLADLAKGLDLPVEGDGEVRIAGLASLADAGPEDLSFIRSDAYLEALAESRAGAVIALDGIPLDGRPGLRSDDPSRDS